jgi:hypothetical protein
MTTVTRVVTGDDEMLEFLADTMRLWRQVYVVDRQESEHRARLKIALSKKDGALAASFVCLGPGGAYLGDRVLVRRARPRR